MTTNILTEENVKMNVSLANKEEAVRYSGGILVDQGYVEEAYVEKMMEREAMTSTYIGNCVSIPHGTEEAKNVVKETGISIVTVPGGVDFDGNTVKVLICIASKGEEEMEILSKIAMVCSEEESIEKMLNAQSEEEILDMFDQVN